MQWSKFIVKIPNPETNEYIETIYNTAAEAANALNIKQRTLYLITTNQCKFNHQSTKHLKNIIVIRESFHKAETKEVKQQKSEIRKKVKEEAKLLKQEEENKLILQKQMELIQRLKPPSTT